MPSSVQRVVTAHGRGANVCVSLRRKMGASLKSRGWGWGGSGTGDTLSVDSSFQRKFIGIIIVSYVQGGNAINKTSFIYRNRTKAPKTGKYMNIRFSEPLEVTFIAFRWEPPLVAFFWNNIIKYHFVFLARPTGLPMAPLGTESQVQHTMELPTREMEASLCWGSPQRKWILQRRNNISRAEINSVLEFQIEVFPRCWVHLKSKRTNLHLNYRKGKAPWRLMGSQRLEMNSTNSPPHTRHT